MNMRYIVVLFWTLILGQIVGFLGAKLTSSNYSFMGTVFASIIIGIIVVLMSTITEPKKKMSKHE